MLSMDKIEIRLQLKRKLGLEPVATLDSKFAIAPIVATGCQMLRSCAGYGEKVQTGIKADKVKLGSDSNWLAVGSTFDPVHPKASHDTKVPIAAGTVS